eukprot:c9807_g1_i1.p1 GENE.c9807_g1_i1~~c9807_g1_i1.p1  ORF type:complete len:1237 (+),score=397.28 c9807_g1_i1:522-3713(+)
MASVPGHKLWTSILSKVFDSNWQAVGDDSILLSLVTKTVEEYLNRLNGKDIAVLSASNLLDDENSERTDKEGILAVRHLMTIRAPEHHEFNKVAPAQPVLVVTRMLISTVDEIGTRGFDFISDHWSQIRVSLASMSSEAADIQLRSFARVTPTSFAIDFTSSMHYSFVEAYSRMLTDMVNSRLFENLVVGRGFEIRDAIVLSGPSVDALVRAKTKSSKSSKAAARLAVETHSLIQSAAVSSTAVGPFNSSSVECQGDSETVSCCCETFDAANSRYLGCRLASVWAMNGKCPTSFPFSIPSAAYANQPSEPSICTSNTTVESLIGICELSRCPSGVVQTCDCLQKYINQCLMVGPTAPFPEPCALTRNIAKSVMEAKQCGAETVVCHKPSYLEGTQFTDDCGDSTAVNGTCQITCADGYIATEESTTSSLGMECSASGWQVISGDLKCEPILNCSNAFLANVEGIVHDCEEGAPIRSHCVLSCEPGYVSSVSDEDRVVSYCKTVSPNVAAYNRTISCKPSFCSTAVIPEGLTHNCTDNATIHSTCTIGCPMGQLGEALTATCVGHGGKGAVAAYAEYDFSNLNCTNFNDIPELSSLVVFARAAAGEIPLQIIPDFAPNVTRYTLEVPSRTSEVHLKFAPSKSWTSVTQVVCTGCSRESTADGVLILGDSLHEITIRAEFTKEPLTYNIYTLFINRMPSIEANSPTEATGVIKLDTKYSDTWLEKNGAAFISVVSGLMKISTNDVTINMVLPGSVIIDFSVRAAHMETTAAAFETALIDGSFSKQLCQASQVCATQITLVEPLHAPTAPITWPTPVPTPPPAACSSQEALSCVNHYVNRACQSSSGNGVPSHCLKHNECLRQAKKDDCRFPIREIDGCFHQASEAELFCAYNFVAKDCDDSRKSSSCGPSSCLNATVTQVCPFITECSSKEAKACVDTFINTGCGDYVVVSGCHRYLECQVKAKNSMNHLCPVQAILPAPCASEGALQCIERFIANKCEHAITTPECSPFVTCQKAVKHGQDPLHKCPSPAPQPALTPQQLLWIHIMLLYRFQLLFGGHMFPVFV